MLPELTWTEIEFVVLEPGQRSPTVPDDTASKPYVARVRGLAEAAAVGSVAEVETVVGRRLQGHVTAVNPGYEHTFGHPLPEWISMRDSIRRALDEQRSTRTERSGRA